MESWKIIEENKLKGVIYTRETLFINYLEDLRRIDICPEAREYYEEVYQNNKDMTFGEVVDNYPPKQGWAKSMLSVYDGQLSEEVRRSLMNCVKDDVMNYRLWRTLVNITDDERSMLREKFRGKLPNIERKL